MKKCFRVIPKTYLIVHFKKCLITNSFVARSLAEFLVTNFFPLLQGHRKKKLRWKKTTVKNSIFGLSGRKTTVEWIKNYKNYARVNKKYG